MKNDERFRHECEVRQVLAWRVERGREWVQQWLRGVGEKRGAAAAERIRGDATEQWEQGNRGVRDDWR